MRFLVVFLAQPNNIKWSVVIGVMSLQIVVIAIVNKAGFRLFHVPAKKCF